MKAWMRHGADGVMRLSRLEYFPVRVKAGVAAGARWTLYPWTSYWRGTHEPEFQAVMIGLCGNGIEGWTCWDLGAHFGIYSVGLARRVGPTGQVAAFEPDPRNHRRLARHARMNGLSWLKTYPAAVSDRAGAAELYIDGQSGSSVGHLPYEGELRTAGPGALSVRTVRLDELVRSGELRPPKLIKLDVEGHGHRALAGAAETIKAHRPIIIMSLHSPQESRGAREALGPLGYSQRRVGTGGSEDGILGDFLFLPEK